MLVPSIGRWGTPSTDAGCRMPAASKIVGPTSMTWLNWLRMPPVSLMRSGHTTTTPCRVPPKNDATCFVHLNGASTAHAQGAAKCGAVSGPPHVS